MYKHIALLAILAGWPFLWPAAQVQVTRINPTQTDPTIQAVHGEHLAYVDTAIPSRHTLLLMIVGTGGAAAEHAAFDSFAASRGYHVLSIDYKNTVITTACSNSEDSTCFDRFRQEIVFGEPLSPLVEVDSANCIYHRLYALLQYLSKNHPRQHWQQYLEGSSIQWSRVIVAGHSQGAGHAAYLAKQFPLKKVLIFAGPQDYLARFNAPAAWLRARSRTAANRYYAFLHLQDPFNFHKQLAGCLALMGASRADTVGVRPGLMPHTRKHILVTGIASGNPHGAMLQPVFAPAWAYLLGDGNADR